MIGTNGVSRAVAGNAYKSDTLEDSLWNSDGEVCANKTVPSNFDESFDNIWLMDCSSTETNASGDAETVAATNDGFGSTGNAIKKLFPSLDGNP